MKKRIMQALARGYCTDRNSKKDVDSELIEDMAIEIKKVINQFKKRIRN